MIINGKQIADTILSQIKQEVAAMPFQPVFCDVLVGNDSVSASYVKIKGKKAVEAGMKFLPVLLPGDISQKALEAKIRELNLLPGLCGLVVQLPLPQGLAERPVLDTVLPACDVDGMGWRNQELFYSGQAAMVMPTAAAIRAIFETLQIDIHKQVVVVGQGELVGRPTAFLLKKMGYSVKTADRSVGDIKALCLEADVLVSATGTPNLITGDMVKAGSVVIDAGTSESGGSIVGDVDAASVGPVAGFLTPVPGGVGPVTVAMLLSNVLACAKEKLK
ncbi:MAG: bifunctional 5,10-methylenetetrahydrofolate dehydrogenase/5,10-methenyltetrahydrofolate cyclohydrolase [Patescibacteria group bacterium]|nr:bifunctional 5,10-methylenetetrahydrofolate dehydrogenase/5,10-methenyltetrahydrofolate cyclohydrolase [Patescibacteria group bacterium]